MKKWKDRSQQQTNKTHKVLDNMVRKKEIDKKLVEYIYIKRLQLGIFHLLPKIHKRTTRKTCYFQ